jgi:hypothetical protein
MLEIKSLGIWHKRWFVLYENGILAYHKANKVRTLTRTRIATVTHKRTARLTLFMLIGRRRTRLSVSATGWWRCPAATSAYRAQTGSVR